jgi:hypothetical protein
MIWLTAHKVLLTTGYQFQLTNISISNIKPFEIKKGGLRKLYIILIIVNVNKLIIYLQAIRKNKLIIYLQAIRKNKLIIYLQAIRKNKL